MTEKQFKLSKKKRKWVGQFKPTVTLRGAPLNYPVGVEQKYTRAVRTLIDGMMRAAEKGVKAAFKKPVAKEYFAEDADIATETNKILDALFERLQLTVDTRAQVISESMVEASNERSQVILGFSLRQLSDGVTLQPSLLGGDIPAQIEAATHANVGLIAGIAAAYLGKLSDAVNRSIMTGRGLADLVPFMETQRGITKRHAKNVALDQVRGVFNSLNRVRMENVGVYKFQWLHTGASALPRPFHIARFPKGLNGGVYDIRDPPVIDPKTGVRGYPGQLIHCKCRMIPVIVLEEGRIAA